MDLPVGPREPVELARDECPTLLALESPGWLAVRVAPAALDVVPVDYVMRSDVAIIRTHAGVVLDQMVSGPVTLRVDRVDWFHRTGWSVMVQGRVELVETDSRDIDEPDVWDPGPHQILVKTTPSLISGRRLELHQESLDAAGYL